VRPTAQDAARRAPVVVRQGDRTRLGTLLGIPGAGRRRSKGAKARVRLPSGAVIAVPLAEIELA